MRRFTNHLVFILRPRFSTTAICRPAIYSLTLCLAAAWPALAQLPQPLHAPWGPDRDFQTLENEVPIYQEQIGDPTQDGHPDAAHYKVSADELRHPLSNKGRSILLKALNFADKGQHRRAIAIIKEGMAKVRSFIPYGHEILGVEYVRTGRDKEAVSELQQSTQLFPHDASGHSNLAVSLCLTGDLAGAEREAKLALYLEPTLSPAHKLVELIDEVRSGHAQVSTAGSD